MRLTIAQGAEMGRPSRLEASAEKRDGKVTAIWIGGRCVPVMRGPCKLYGGVGRMPPARSNAKQRKRSPEQMLKELRARLQEISDLSGASAVLIWDQATYMPEGGGSGALAPMRAREQARA